MKTLAITTAVALLMAAPALAAVTELKTDMEKRSYAIGANVAKNIRQQKMAIDPAMVSQGLLDELAGKSLLSDAEQVKIMQQLQGEVRQNLKADFEKASVENKKRGEAYLAENKKKAGVKVLPSGVQYKVIKAGSGKQPTDKDTVLCNYRGTLVDGKPFDASQTGKPVAFKVDQVIPGWQEALKLMTVGSQWQLVIPADKAYGERGAGNAIGPNETLIFEVELLEIQ